MIFPRVRARLDRPKKKMAVSVGQGAARSSEVCIERHIALICLVPVTSRCICLPHLHQCTGNWPPVFVEHAPMHHDPFPNRLPVVLRVQVAIERPAMLGPSTGPKQLDSASGINTSGFRGDLLREEP
jgi:hypothetical protein